MTPQAPAMKAVRALALVVVMAGTISCDQVTKHFAADTLAGRPAHSFLSDTVRVEYAENTGAFLSLGSTWPTALRTTLFTIGAGLLLLAALAGAIRYRWRGPALFGVCLLAAGGLSNVADRIARGSVIDFLNIGWGPVRTGVFNIADIAVMAGSGLLLWAHLRRARVHDDRSVGMP
jgi:signal peptidase II